MTPARFQSIVGILCAYLLAYSIDMPFFEVTVLLSLSYIVRWCHKQDQRQEAETLTKIDEYIQAIRADYEP